MYIVLHSPLSTLLIKTPPPLCGPPPLAGRQTSAFISTLHSPNSALNLVRVQHIGLRSPLSTLLIKTPPPLCGPPPLQGRQTSAFSSTLHSPNSALNFPHSALNTLNQNPSTALRSPSPCRGGKRVPSTPLSALHSLNQNPSTALRSPSPCMGGKRVPSAPLSTLQTPLLTWCGFSTSVSGEPAPFTLRSPHSKLRS